MAQHEERRRQVEEFMDGDDARGRLLQAKTPKTISLLLKLPIELSGRYEEGRVRAHPIKAFRIFCPPSVLDKAKGELDSVSR